MVRGDPEGARLQQRRQAMTFKGTGFNREAGAIMQTSDVYKQVSFISVLEALKRRKYYILIPTLLLAVGFGVFGYMLPDRYRTRALLAAEPMATAHDYVNAAGTAHTTHIVNVEEQLRKVREIVYSTP